MPTEFLYRVTMSIESKISLIEQAYLDLNLEEIVADIDKSIKFMDNPHKNNGNH